MRAPPLPFFLRVFFCRLCCYPTSLFYCPCVRCSYTHTQCSSKRVEEREALFPRRLNPTAPSFPTPSRRLEKNAHRQNNTNFKKCCETKCFLGNSHSNLKHFKWMQFTCFPFSSFLSAVQCDKKITQGCFARRPRSPLPPFPLSPPWP